MQEEIDIDAKLADLIPKKPLSKKEKERKILDFKFRTIDLLEIFINKTKTPEKFLGALIPLIDCLKENINDANKQNFIEKIANLLRRFFERKLNFAEEYYENLKQCFSHLIYVLAKINSNKAKKVFEFILNTIIKIFLEMKNSDECKDFILSEYEKALKIFAHKKDIFYSNEFFKFFIKNHYEIGIKLIKTLIELCNLHENQGARDEYKRSNILNILHYALFLPKENDKKTLLLKENIQIFENVCTNLFEKRDLSKKNSFSNLNKLSQIILNTQTLLKSDKESLKINKTFKKNLCDCLSKISDSDKNFTKLIENIIKNLQN